MVKREKYIKIMVSDREHEQIKNAAKENNTTVARFVRDTILNHVNPKETNGLTKNAIIKMFEDKILLIEEKNKLLEEKYLKEIELLEAENLRMKQIRDFPSKLDETMDINEKIELISNTIERIQKTNQNTPVSLNILQKETKIDRDELFDILNRTPIFKNKGRGWVKNE